MLLFCQYKKKYTDILTCFFKWHIFGKNVKKINIKNKMIKKWEK